MLTMLVRMARRVYLHFLKIDAGMIRVENDTGNGVYLSKNVVKHCLSCLIYLLNRNSN